LTIINRHTTSLLRTIYSKNLLLFFILLISFDALSQTIALPHAHSHNDYNQKHPLTDALNAGFTSIEADIFFVHGNFTVAHFFPFLKKRKTLETLYLKPLLDSITKHYGIFYKNYNEPIVLLIDIKSDADRTYTSLIPLLKKYSSILSSYENGVVTNRTITIILTGHKPYNLFIGQSLRYAFIDENLMSDNKLDKNICPYTSTKYSNILSWKGKGEIPDSEKLKLISLTSSAHEQGKKVRLWASPENKNVWKELLNCGVDLINTDDLEGLKLFLLKENK
jgi:hypothetical protein